MLRGRSTDTPGPSRAGTWSGAIWSVAIALVYFFLSSPLALVPSFDVSLRLAVLCTSVACLMTLTALRVPNIPLAAVLFLAFCLTSSTWSINSGDTVHFTALYLVLTVLAVIAASNVEIRAIAHGIAGGAFLIMVTSLYAYWQDLPNSHVPPGSSGYLAGVGINRNILAYTMILAFPFAVALVPRHRWARAGWAVSVLAVLSGILLAESATGVAAVCVLSGAAIALSWRDRLCAKGRRPGLRHWSIIGAVVVALLALGVGWYVSLQRDFQRDLSLTGRVAIWEAAWGTSSHRARIIGDGFGSVWMHPWRHASPNGQFEAITRELGRYEPHGHNSVMDLVPEVGFVGVGLFALLYLVPLVRAGRRRNDVTSETRVADRVVVLGVVALVLAGVTEPISTVPLGFYLAILLIAHDPSEAPGGGLAARRSSGPRHRRDQPDPAA